MKIFPEQPSVSKDDVLRIMPKISNRSVLRQWLKLQPEKDDLKRAVMIELFRALEGFKSPMTALKRGVFQDLVVAIQRIERGEVDACVLEILTDATVPEKIKAAKKKTPEQEALVESNNAVAKGYKNEPL